MRRSAGVLLASFVSSALFAQHVEVPVTNWTVPPDSRSSGGLTTMTDFTPPRAFIAVAPCRVVDTRNAAGLYGGPALAPNIARAFDIHSGPCTGIPDGVDAYSLSIGAIVPPADGFLTAWPTGTTQPLISQLNFLAGRVVANAAIIPVGIGGSIDVLVNTGPTNIYIDINGYFSEQWSDQSDNFELVNNSSTAVATFANIAPSCTGACGIRATIASAGSGRAITGAAGEAGADSAGVFGRQGLLFGFPGSYPGAGVRGESTQLGVVGISQTVGVSGSLVNTSGGVVAEGYLGFNSGPGYGVWSTANYGGAGAKFFVEPHPTDASKVIRYISLEGPEPGTYFRGRGKFERGMARIRVPDDFRMVTDAEGLTVQITPIGGMASVGVIRADLNEIVVQSSRNLEFYYLVNGIRRTHKHLTSPIGEGNEYMPRSADATIPLSLTEGQRQLLIQNGTYNANGTVNMETARRLGWDRVWAERERPSPEPAP